MNRFFGAVGVVVAMALSPAVAQAAPPQITATGFTAVSETGATLTASVDPTGGKTSARFDYTTLAGFKAEGFAGAQSLPAGGIEVPAKASAGGNLLSGSDKITGVTPEAGSLGLGQTISATGGGIPGGTTITAIEVEPSGKTLKLTISNNATATESTKLSASGPQPIAAISGLSPATAYVFRALATKAGAGNEDESPPTTFHTYAPSPIFDPCPNDDLRLGAHAAPGAPGALLPDCRSYELASPLEKNGGDALSTPGYARAASDGSAVVFGSTFGVPGAEGAQTLPFYQAFRTSSWSTVGLFPPAGTGQSARLLVGQLPDLSATYATVLRYGPSQYALFELHRDGSPPVQITPYADFKGGIDDGIFGFAGASADGSSILFESPIALPVVGGGEPIAGERNLYAWERATGQLHLASVMNSGPQTELNLGKGAYAGSYGSEFDSLRDGGAINSHLLAEQHAVTPQGSIFFTSRSDGHIYERLHPTAPQSALDSDGNCTEPDKACTLDLSSPHRAEPDTAGAQPAVFQLATPDGSQAFFTSSEKLTEDANTGPPQPLAAIARTTIDGNGGIEGQFIPKRAVGIARSGPWIYWAEPKSATIGRAKLDAEEKVILGSEDPEFISIPPSEGECEEESDPQTAPGVFKPIAGTIPSEPRYVAVDSGHVYWTSTGRSDSFGGLTGGGTIGRATLDGEEELIPDSVEPAFICGEEASQPGKRLVSNPQGIAVDSEHIYWANAAQSKEHRTIARANTDGTDAEENFVTPFGEISPYGVALSSTHLYFAINGGDNEDNASYLERVNLEGKEPTGSGLGERGVRGLAVDSGHLYWATQGEGGVIGRSDLNLDNIEKEFIDVEGVPNGLAASATHLFWSANGENPGNPGADLYRYRSADGTLTDLVPHAGGNGAEVRGVLGASDDGSYVYFAANADLDGSGPAEAGDCSGRRVSQSNGHCSIYLVHQGEVAFVARVDSGGGGSPQSLSYAGAINWLWRTYAIFDASSFTPKSSRVSADGHTLVFESGSTLYRYRVGEDPVCVSCNPSGAATQAAATTGSAQFGRINPSAKPLGATQIRFASADGNRVFFETTEALVAADADAIGGCDYVKVAYSPSCLDVYEWEAPGSGSCTLAGPGYSALNEGCLYLISQGTGTQPAFFADASASGDDAFFFTREQLVREDTDQLQDVYDARVGGGLLSQNPLFVPPCEGEGCKPAATPPPVVPTPPSFSGPADPKPKRCKAKRCHRKKHHGHKGAKKNSRGHRSDRR